MERLTENVDMPQCDVDMMSVIVYTEFKGRSSIKEVTFTISVVCGVNP